MATDAQEDCLSQDVDAFEETSSEEKAAVVEKLSYQHGAPVRDPDEPLLGEKDPEAFSLEALDLDPPSITCIAPMLCMSGVCLVFGALLCFTVITISQDGVNTGT
jgi:hypothetical protein